MTDTPTPAPAPMTARLRELMEEATNARDDQRRAEAVHDGDAWQKAGYREIAALNERDLLIRNNAPTILRLLEAVEGAEKALAGLEEAATVANTRHGADRDKSLDRAIIAARSALATLRAAREGAR